MTCFTLLSILQCEKCWYFFDFDYHKNTFLVGAAIRFQLCLAATSDMSLFSLAFYMCVLTLFVVFVCKNTKRWRPTSSYSHVASWTSVECQVHCLVVKILTNLSHFYLVRIRLRYLYQDVKFCMHVINVTWMNFIAWRNWIIKMTSEFNQDNNFSIHSLYVLLAICIKMTILTNAWENQSFQKLSMLCMICGREAPTDLFLMQVSSWCLFEQNQLMW